MCDYLPEGATKTRLVANAYSQHSPVSPLLARTWRVDVSFSSFSFCLLITLQSLWSHGWQRRIEKIRSWHSDLRPCQRASQDPRTRYASGWGRLLFIWLVQGYCHGCWWAYSRTHRLLFSRWTNCILWWCAVCTGMWTNVWRHARSILDESKGNTRASRCHNCLLVSISCCWKHNAVQYLAHVVRVLNGFPFNRSAHEYTESNAKFAVSVEPGNSELMKRFVQVKEQRARGEPTVPTQIGLEKLTNPFLRVDISEEIRAKVGVTPGDSDADAFAKVRRAKDNFRG